VLTGVTVGDASATGFTGLDFDDVMDTLASRPDEA
jgi:hypothetical protein